MRAYQIGTSVVALGLTLFAFQNCARQGEISSSTVNTVDSVEMQKTMATLKSEIIATSARDLGCVADADCVSVGVGKRCGGPSFYVLNSVKSQAYGSVLALASTYKDVERNYMSATQSVSSCEYLSPPPSACVQNRCVNSVNP